MSIKWYSNVEPFGRKYLKTLEKLCDAKQLYDEAKKDLNYNRSNDRMSRNENLLIIGEMFDKLFEKGNLIDESKKAALDILYAAFNKEKI